MNHVRKTFAMLVLPVLVVGVGCKKNAATPQAVAAVATPASNSAGSVPTALPSSSPTSLPGLTVETTSGLKGADWAMKQDAISQDANGQWAVTASSSSSYNDASGHDEYSPFQATGAPNVETEGDNSNAWTAKEPDAGLEWLDLVYSKPVFANAVRIRESAGAGAVAKVDLYDEQGQPHTVWTGTDPTTGLNYFMLNLPKTAFKTNHLRLTLATNVISGYNEIDAVQLIGTEQ
jgi:hypothetical protein